MQEGVDERALQFDKAKLHVQLEPAYPTTSDHASLYRPRLPTFQTEITPNPLKGTKVP
jgi:hypothetical protein